VPPTDARIAEQAVRTPDKIDFYMAASSIINRRMQTYSIDPHDEDTVSRAEIAGR